MGNIQRVLYNIISNLRIRTTKVTGSFSQYKTAEQTTQNTRFAQYMSKALVYITDKQLVCLLIVHISSHCSPLPSACRLATTVVNGEP